MTELDPMLIEVWRHLATLDGDESVASTFFRRHLIDGERLIESVRENLAAVPTEPVGSAGASRRVSAKSRPQTEFNPQRHREIIERKWLSTGFVGILREPGAPARRLPLSYRQIRLGTPHTHPDIAFELAADARFEGRLELSEGGFRYRHSNGNVKMRLNGNEITDADIASGDCLQIGAYELAVQKTIEAAGELMVVSDPGAGERFVLDLGVVRIGRPGKRANDINLPSPTVSREHATITFHDDRFWIVPDSSTSPTVVNGVTVRESRALVDKDQIVLGEQILLFRTRGQVDRPRALHEVTATVLFADLRGWTTLAETTPLESLIRQLDDYYKAMGDIIQRYGGTVMAYQGDAMMAVFGAPSVHADDPWRAVASAMRMLEARATMNARWRQEGKAQLSGGIGIHTGQVVVGEIGHASRIEYVAMGDATNLAARLEQLTRDYDCSLLISDATHAAIANVVDARSLGSVTVRGRTSPTTIYRVLALRNT